MFRRPILCHVLCHSPLRRTRTYEIKLLIRLAEDRRAEVKGFVGWKSVVDVVKAHEDGMVETYWFITRIHCLISLGQLVSSAPNKDSTAIKGAKDKAMHDPRIMEARG